MNDDGEREPQRVTISLTKKSVERVKRLSEKHEDTKTDTINRAIALYDMLDEIEDGAGLYTRDSVTGSWIKLRLVR